jgi:signal peptidase
MALRRPRSRRRRGPGIVQQGLQLASVAYLAALGGLLWWSHAPMLVGWQPKVVLTGSMLPVIRPGDVALIGPADARGGGLPAGRIVLVRDAARESGSYLHRVVRYEDDGTLVTKGDANQSEDHPTVDPARVRGQLRLLVPAVGRPVIWVHDHRWPMLGGSLAATWAAMVFALSLRREPDDDRAGDPAADLADLADVPARPDPTRPAAPEPVSVVAVPPAGPQVSEVDRLVLDLDAFEAAFGPGFGAADGDDVSDYDGRGFAR